MRWVTPPGVAGVAVLAVPESLREFAFDHLRGRRGVRLGSVPNALCRAELLVAGQVLDEILVVDRAPNGLELHLHGAPAVHAALAAAGWPIRTEPCLAAERLLRDALDVPQLDLALEQLSRPFADFLRELRELPPASRASAVVAACARSRVAMAHCTAERLVLMGRPNAGKSTLFNRLLGRERVLTGPRPGLTRDPVVERICLDGYPYDLIDTAGEGEGLSGVDAEAVGAGRAARASALRVLVVDASRGPDAIDRSLLETAALVVANKTDLQGPAWPREIPCQLRVAGRRDSTGELQAKLGAALRLVRGLPTAGPVGGGAALDLEEFAQLLALA
ncbi:MAG: 50S ribosome-binding GTPase [Planctomycetes bacterium]|nr:50S ribosome-binding GTPase [Planctomycetota bacterium]